MSWLIQYDKLKTMSPSQALGHVHQLMLEKVQMGLSSTECQKLEVVLNQLEREMSNEENREQYTAKLKEAMNKSNASFIVTNKLNVTSEKAILAWKEYEKANKKVKEITTEANQADAADKLKKAKKLSKALNTVKGQAFESFLQASLKSINSIKTELIDKNVDDLKQEIKVTSKDVISEVSKTSGSEHTTMTFVFNDEHISIHSPQKVDVQVPNPFSSIAQEASWLNISAKNVANLSKNIHLLGKGNALGMIHAWPIEDKTTQLFYTNLLTLYSFEGELEKRYQEMRLAFGIQSLISHKKDDPYADTLVVNIRRRKNPIVVIPIKQLLTNILNETAEKYSAFDVKISGIKTEGYRNEKELTPKLKSIIVDSSLNKRYLSVAYLKQLRAMA